MKRCSKCGGRYHIGHKCVRDWNAYYNEDGEPWAIFLHGHDHDLRTLRSLACKEEMRRACLSDDEYFSGNLNVGRWWIRDLGDAADDPEHSWHFCEKGDKGAIPISGAKFE